jgi:lysophospholipase L1-like esterase
MTLVGLAAGSRADEARCQFPPELLKAEKMLPRAAARLDSDGAMKIVAFGSSSTAGAGASRAEATYPARLKSKLEALLPERHVEVVNRGRNGDRVGDMLGRIRTDVLPEDPDLVIWQVGTNAVLTDLEPYGFGRLLLEGADAVIAAGPDLIIMDPQYAPKVLLHPHAPDLVRVVHDAARQVGAALFRRFELMRFWHEQLAGFEHFLSADQLHMNDWSYDCLADALALGMVDSLRLRK